MAKEFAKSFYNSPAWKKTRAAYISKRHFLCEDCLMRGEFQPGEIVHHIIELTPENITDAKIALDEGNLRLLCRSCHKKIHGAEAGRRWVVDSWGNVRAR